MNIDLYFGEDGEVKVVRDTIHDPCLPKLHDPEEWMQHIMEIYVVPHGDAGEERIMRPPESVRTAYEKITGERFPEELNRRRCYCSYG